MLPKGKIENRIEFAHCDISTSILQDAQRPAGWPRWGPGQDDMRSVNPADTVSHARGYRVRHDTGCLA